MYTPSFLLLFSNIYLKIILTSCIALLDTAFHKDHITNTLLTIGTNS